jgi:hypothetical protein
MTNLFTQYNERETYVVLDEAGNVVNKFRLKIAADKFILENEKYYIKLSLMKQIK